MTIAEVLKEIERQIDTMQWLREHPEVAQNTVMRETDEYCRGALSILKYLKTYIEIHEER